MVLRRMPNWDIIAEYCYGFMVSSYQIVFTSKLSPFTIFHLSSKIYFDIDTNDTEADDSLGIICPRILLQPTTCSVQQKTSGNLWKHFYYLL